MKLASSSSIAAVAAILAVGSAGCADAAEDTGSAASNLGSEVTNPSGAYFASVTANGTGCPVGSWDAKISDDGQYFSVTFQAYSAIVRPGVAFSIKDCTLSIDLETPADASFAVTSFSHPGFAFLDKAGMKASETAKFYFQGNPLPARELRRDQTGPFAAALPVSDKIPTAARVWSPCGSQRRLNAQTRLVLQNNAKKTGNGFLDMTAVDLSLRIGIAWKRCGDGPGPEVDAGPAEPTGNDAGSSSSSSSSGSTGTDGGAAPASEDPPADRPRGDDADPGSPTPGPTA